jgi:hypothetical protein
MLGLYLGSAIGLPRVLFRLQSQISPPSNPVLQSNHDHRDHEPRERYRDRDGWTLMDDGKQDHDR